MNPLAEELNATIREASPGMYAALSELGRSLFFPRGILSQTAEAKQGAHRYNATIGTARSRGEAMHLPAVMDRLPDLGPSESLDYAPAAGNPALREKWKEEIYRKNPSLEGRKTSLPVVTSGITHGLTLTGELFMDPGDEVVLPDKFWGNYRLLFEVKRGARIVTYPLFSSDGGFNTDGMREVVDRVLEENGKAVVILNFPNNPTGYSVRRGESEAIAEALLGLAGTGREVVAVLDDAYFGLFYGEDVLDESLFGILASENPDLFLVKLDGATKELYAWGLRVGFMTFNALAAGAEEGLYGALEKKVAGAIRGGISNCSQLSQALLLRALEEPGLAGQRQQKYETMRARARKVAQALEGERYDAVWEPYPFNSGYFMCLKLKGIEAEELRKRLLERHGVGVIATGDDLRIAFSCLEETEIGDLFDIIYRCALEMKGETRE